jgi:hypothetical protein
MFTPHVGHGEGDEEKKIIENKIRPKKSKNSRGHDGEYNDKRSEKGADR